MNRKFLLGFLLVSTTLTLQAEKHILINLADQTLTAKDDNGIFMQTIVSTGMVGHRTPTGEFKAFAKVKDNKSTLYPKRSSGKNGGAPMRYTIRVTHDGIAIHEGFVPKLSSGDAYPASHGCIRVPFGKAKKLYEWTSINTPIKIVGVTKHNNEIRDLERQYTGGNAVADEAYREEFGDWGSFYYDNEESHSFVYVEGSLDYLDNL